MCVCVATRCRFVVLWTSSIFIFAGCARVTAAGAVEVCEGARGFEGELRVLTGKANRTQPDDESYLIKSMLHKIHPKLGFNV